MLASNLLNGRPPEASFFFSRAQSKGGVLTAKSSARGKVLIYGEVWYATLHRPTDWPQPWFLDPPPSVGNGPGDINCYDWGPSELSLGKDQPKHTRAAIPFGCCRNRMGYESLKLKMIV